MSTTETVIDPAGPALTTTVRLPGLGGTLEPGIVVVGTVVVLETLVVEVTVVVGASEVVGVLDVVGVELVVGALVEGLELVAGLSEVVVASVFGVGLLASSGGALKATAAVSPTQTATVVVAIRKRLLVTCVVLLV